MEDKPPNEEKVVLYEEGETSSELICEM